MSYQTVLTPEQLKQISEFYERIIQAAIEGDDEEVISIYEEAQSSGYEFEVDSNDTTEWEEGEDGYNWPIVTQANELTLGKVPVTSWKEKWIGEYGSMGTGWWILNVDTEDMQEGIIELLETLDLSVDKPFVPKPVLIEKDKHGH